MPRPLADCAPPRLFRALFIEVLLIAAGATMAQLPWTKPSPQARPSPTPAKPKPPERRVRVVRLPPEAPKLALEQRKPAPAQLARATPPAPATPALARVTPAPQPATPTPQPATPAPPPVTPAPAPPMLAQAAPPPEPVHPAPPEPARMEPARSAASEPARPAPSHEVSAAPAELPPRPAPPRPAPAPTRIAADSREVHGVRLHVMVPRDPDELAAHLRGSGGCLVVSRLDRDGAEVLEVLGIEASGTVELPGPPCEGVPRLLNDAALDLALGDPLGRAQSAHPGERLALQVLLTPRLPAIAQETLRERFGDLPQDELARRAAEAGYELTCFAEPAGSVRCE